MRPQAVAWRRRCAHGLALAGAILMFCCLVAVPAYASEPGWTISSASSPTNFAAGDETGDDSYVLTVVDNGEGVSDGSPIEIADALPGGLVASSISGKDLGNGEALECQLKPLGCNYEGHDIAPGDVLQIAITVKVEAGAASSVLNTAKVTGGGAIDGARTEESTTVSSSPAGFGVSRFATTWSGTQAGSSVNLTAGFTLNQLVSNGETVPVAAVKDIELDLPSGFTVNPTAIQACSESDAQAGDCPMASAVGVAFTSRSSGVGGAPIPSSNLLYNLSPTPGEAGALALMLPGGAMRLGLEIRADGSYGLRVAMKNLTQVAPLISMSLTLWGVPGLYNGFGPGPDHVLAGSAPSFGSPGDQAARFLSSADTCGVSSVSKLSVDSWLEPTETVEASSTTAPLTGCDGLPFDPTLAVVAEINEANEPAGYSLDLHVPQHEEPQALSSAELKEAAVKLPEGADISISAADGLQGCSEAEVGLRSSAPASCPNASKVGQVAVRSPLFPNPLEGAVYLARANENPFASLLALYVVAEDSVAGVSIKLAGRLEADPRTGQLTIVLRELPQLPISNLELHFFGGARALLTTPPSCGLATTTSELTPSSGTAIVSPASNFEIQSAANGTPCSETQPFSPTLNAIGTTNEAGAYDSLSFVVERADQEASLSKVEIQTPPAVAEMFSGVPRCEYSQANEGTCGEESKIGSVTLIAGTGPDPYHLNGLVYLTNAYRGLAQGLSIVVPFNVGPFDLGNVIIRANAGFNSLTGGVTIETDSLPKILAGIPVRLKTFALQLDRGQFRLNPDGCEPLTIKGELTDIQGSLITVAAPQGPASQCNPPTPTPQVPDPMKSVSSHSVASVSLLESDVKATNGGEALLKLRCSGPAACSGKLTLTIKTRGKGKRRRLKETTIGTGNFSIAAGKEAGVELKLDAAARALLHADHGRLKASLAIRRSSPAPSQTHTETVHLLAQKVRGEK
jgi:hypothetical protein